MTEMTEPEARAVVYALSTAMMEGDKESREMIYENLTNEELKKVLRWAMRKTLVQHAQLCGIIGLHYKETWQAEALQNALGESND